MKRLLVLLAMPMLLVAGDEKKKAPRPMAEVTLRVIEATSAANAPNDGADLVPAELKALLKFTRYRLMDSAYVRGVEDESMRVSLAGDLSGKIRFELRVPGLQRSGTLSELLTREGDFKRVAGERGVVQPVPLLEFAVQIDGPPDGSGKTPRLLETTTTAKSGETVVLGASRMRGSSNALIVVLTGKLLQPYDAPRMMPPH